MIAFRLTGNPEIDQYIEAACEAYERELRAGRRPPFGPLLEGLPPKAQAVLRRKLEGLCDADRPRYDGESYRPKPLMPNTCCVAITYDTSGKPPLRLDKKK